VYPYNADFRRAKFCNNLRGVVLENNNKHLTQLSAEGPPLFRALRASLHE
jgi:hypothetical protein